MSDPGAAKRRRVAGSSTSPSTGSDAAGSAPVRGVTLRRSRPRKAAARAVRPEAAQAFAAAQAEAEQQAQHSDELAAEWELAAAAGGAGGAAGGAGPGGALLLEDAGAKSARLQAVGCAMAESGRFRQAVGQFEAASELTPKRAVLHELRSQALSQLGEWYPAVAAAERATRLEPGWGEGWLTLGRAQLNLGEVALAAESLSRAQELGVREADEDLEFARAQVARRDALLAKAEGGATGTRAAVPLQGVLRATVVDAHVSVEPK